MNILKNEIPTVKPNTWVGVDTEFFGMDGKRLHRPSGKFACLTIALNDPDNTVLFIDQEELITSALTSIDKCVWCFQKAMFDITQLRRYATIKPRKRIWDTLLVERIMFAGYYEKYNMQAIVRHWLHEKVDKEARELFEKATSMTDEMIQYACLDPFYTVRVAQAQRKAIDKNAFNIWTDIDGAVMWSYLAFRGFAIDVEKWKGLAEKNTARYKEIDTQLPINPRSPTQVLPHLKKNGFKNLKATGDDELWKAIIKYPDTVAAKDARLVLESRKYQTRSSRYGEKFLEAVEYDDGVPVIICEYDPNKAETGRSCVSGDTILETSIGTFRIDELPLISSSLCSIITHENRWKPISSVWYKGEEPMYRVTLKNGNSIVCTKAHQFLTSNGWRTLNDIKCGDRVCTSEISGSWKNQNLSRKNISSFIFRKQLGGDGCMQSIPNFSKCNAHINAILSNNSSRGDEREKASNVLCGGKQENNSRNERKIIKYLEKDKIGQATTDFFSLRRSNGMVNCQAFECVPTNGKKEFQELSTPKTFRTPVQSVRGSVGRIRDNGKLYSWDYGCCLSGHRQPKRIFSSSVRCNCENESGTVANGWNNSSLFLLHPKEENTERLHCMENESSRSFIVGGVEEARDISHSRVPVGITRATICGGLFHSTNKSSDRNQWINSQIKFHQEERSGERKFCKDKECSTPNFDFQRSSNEFTTNSERYSTSDIESIEFVGIKGVWDITVDDDHSYCANGFINHNSSSSPNMQNIPVRDTKEFRGCFIARPGHVLIIADYAAQEPRITAYYSQDECLLNWFNTGKDPYIEIAKIMFNEEITKSDPRRAKIKAVLLGISYGMSKYGLARQEDISVDEAGRLLEDVLNILSGVRAYIQKQSQNINNIRTLENRKLNVNPYDSQHERNAINGPTQGTASAMKKLSLIRMYKEWKPEWGAFGVVGECHDEIILDVPKEFAKEIEPWAKHIMEDEANKMIPDHSVKFVVDTHIGDTWASK